VCLTYESVYEPSFAETRTITVKKVEVAAEYERVHFIGHAVWNPSLTKEQLLEQASALETAIEQRTGYAAFLVDIQIKHFPPLMTDVDFILDVPTERKLGPIEPLTLIAIIAVIAAIFAIIIWLFWTTWIEKLKLYVCDQCPDYPRFEGWLNYVAHLAEKHPTKYKAIQESKTKDWWAEIPSTIKWIVGGVVVATVGGIVIALISRRRE
jgi:hypothetical protein